MPAPDCVLPTATCYRAGRVYFILKRTALLAKAESLDQRLVVLSSRVREILQQTASFSNHEQQAATRREVVLVGPKMFGEVPDSLGQDRNLYLRRTSVAVGTLIVLDQFLSAGRGDHVRRLGKSRLGKLLRID